jgi:hypothetical protein
LTTPTLTVGATVSMLTVWVRLVPVLPSVSDCVAVTE